MLVQPGMARERKRVRAKEIESERVCVIVCVCNCMCTPVPCANADVAWNAATETLSLVSSGNLCLMCVCVGQCIVRECVCMCVYVCVFASMSE